MRLSILRNFCRSAKPSKYSEKYELSEIEISSILKKQSSSTPIYVAIEVPIEPLNYEQDIETTLAQLKKSSEVQNEKWKTLQESSKQRSLTRFDEGEIMNDHRPQITHWKYGLPFPNIGPNYESIQLNFLNEIPETVNQRVWNKLGLHSETSYDEYERALTPFGNSIDMYGDFLPSITESEAIDQQIAIHREEVLPRIKLNDEKYMEHLRSSLTLNINMPGAIETEHPHRFLPDLRPIEEFRHTPLIPVSDRLLKEFSEKIDRHHRSALYFEVGADTIAQYIMLGLAVYVGYRLVGYALELEDQSDLSYHRLQEKRRMDSLSL